MNVVISERFLPEQGGSIEWLINLFSKWPEPVELVTHSYESETIEFDSSNIKLHRLNILHKDWGLDSIDSIRKYFRIFLYVYKLTKSKQNVNIYCTKVIPEAFPIMILKIFRKNTKIYSFVHGEELLAYESSKQLKVLFWLTIKFIDKCFANSSHTKRQLEKLSKNIPVILSNPCIDIESFTLDTNKNNLRKSIEIPEDVFVLISVSRLVQRKNHKAVIKAVKELKKEHKVLYLIIGEGEEKEALKKLVLESELTNEVKFIGRVSESDKVNYLYSADLYVSPGIKLEYDQEGFGISFVEAQACGLPVVAGNSGGEEDAVLDKKTGYILKKTDSLLDVISLFINNREKYDSFSKEALSFAKRFDVKKSVKTLYENLLK